MSNNSSNERDGAHPETLSGQASSLLQQIMQYYEAELAPPNPTPPTTTTTSIFQRDRYTDHLHSLHDAELAVRHPTRSALRAAAARAPIFHPTRRAPVGGRTPARLLSNQITHPPPTHTMAAQQQMSVGILMGLSASADRRADRLEVWRQQEGGLVASFNAALQQLRLDSPVIFNVFRGYSEYCALASKTAVRSHDLMLWFPHLSKDVIAALKALARFYHGEAKQMVYLNRKEGESESWTAAKDLDEEIIHAANATTIRFIDHSFEVTRFQSFGTSQYGPPPVRRMSPLIDIFTLDSHVVEDTARAFADCKVGQVFLDSPSALRDPNDRRWERERKALSDLCKMTGELMRLPRTMAAINKPTVRQAERLFFCYAVEEINRIGNAADGDERLGRIARGRVLARNHERVSIQLARAIDDETDDVAELSDECDRLAGELVELEEGPRGLGRVFGSWRSMQMG